MFFGQFTTQETFKKHWVSLCFAKGALGNTKNHIPGQNSEKKVAAIHDFSFLWEICFRASPEEPMRRPYEKLFQTSVPVLPKRALGTKN